MSILLDQVIAAVRGCREIMSAPFSVKEKDGASNLVTTADNAVEAHLKKALLEIIPTAAFLGEESQPSAGDTYCFVVDPIDGTANFARGIKACSISVGLTKNGEGLLGVVYNPFTEELYYAEAGAGAFLNGNPISVSNRDFTHGLYYTALSLYRKELGNHCLNILNEVYYQCADFRREGSAALELCRLASGQAELYFEIRIFPWDCCAAEIILKEAGGISHRLYTEGLSPDAPFPLVAANTEENFRRLLSIVKKEIPKLPENYN